MVVFSIIWLFLVAVVVELCFLIVGLQRLSLSDVGKVGLGSSLVCGKLIC